MKNTRREVELCIKDSRNLVYFVCIVRHMNQISQISLLRLMKSDVYNQSSKNTFLQNNFKRIEKNNQVNNSFYTGSS